jgi:hypothetical protein
MERKLAQYVNVKGMNKDLSISKFNPQFIYHGYNIRLDSVEDNTLMTITNEKGNKKIDIKEIINKDGKEEIRNSFIIGKTVGYCIISKYLILFTTGEGY